MTGFASLALAASSVGPSPAGAATAATTTPCPSTLPGAPGIAAGSAINASNATSELNGLQGLGSQWVRLDVPWSAIQSQGPNSYDWSPTDTPIQDATARGINVDGILAYSPGWAEPTGAIDDHYPPTNLAYYASFAAAAVRHYAPMGVHTWEIWNEPNNPQFWRPGANVVQYTAMLKQAYVAIKGADPTATVLTGGTSPETTTSTSLSPIDFLAGIYANGGRGSFDAVAHHPYSYPVAPSTYEDWSAWSQMAQTNPSLRSVMTANGDGNKKIWATEWGAPTNQVTEAQQAAMVAQAYADFASYSWAGPLFVYSYKDLGTDTSNNEDWFGLMRNDGSLKPSWSSFQSASAAFSATCGGPPPPPPPPCTTYTSASTGSHQVCGAIRDKYLSLGGPSGFLGYPVTDETGTPDGVGRFNHFANSGSIYWTPWTGAWSIHGAIRAKWASMGWETSVLGYPVTDETGTPDGVGRFNHFANSGSIYWTPWTGAWSIHGMIRAKWASMGWERSCLGYPVSDEFGIAGGRQSNLQRGMITFAWATGWANSSC